jgi:hypothetical protein
MCTYLQPALGPTNNLELKFYVSVESNKIGGFGPCLGVFKGSSRSHFFFLCNFTRGGRVLLPASRGGGAIGDIGFARGGGPTPPRLARSF